ncbi:TonB-dependent siderophore receptor [Nostoc sp.]|uniref:TonB-dependent siderophore receptor n=1 Tax=Nostoc sp. TaxID=1180 RepID=UPI002FF6FFBB
MLNLWQRRCVATCRQTSLFLASVFCLLDIQAVWAKSPFLTKDDTETTLTSLQIKDEKSSIRRVRDLERVSTRVADLFAQQPTNTPAISITEVKANPTDKGVEIILQTSVGQQLQVINRSTGNNFIADVSGGQLRLPSGEAFAFRSEKPLTGITEVTVTNIDANTVRVTVVGEKTLPTVELFDDNAGLVFGINSAATAMQPSQTPPTQEQPPSETPQDEPAAQQDQPIELVVTGEQDGYRVPDTTTGTRTDTPLRDIPQSIQVVPQQVLRDQRINRLDDALRNVAGVTPEFTNGANVYYRIRGFEASNNNLLRNGLPDPGVGDAVELANVERVEVLRGPASVLFGLGNPGGSINIVTKRPLSEPFYAIDATVGSYSFYRGAVDLSGPLNDSKSFLYRLNTAYRNSGSFLDFNSSENFSISPAFSMTIGKRTNLNLSAEYIESRDSGLGFGVPIVGSTLPNPNGKIPRNRNLTEPTDEANGTTTRIGYELEHKFSDNWSLRNAFRYGFNSYYIAQTRPETLDTTDNRTISRSFSIYDQYFTNYTLTTNVVGKFSTGSIEHQLLFGVDLNRYINATPKYVSFAAASIDIFNPVYGQPIGELNFEAINSSTTDSLGIFIQDQIAITESLKVLLGARFDTFNQTSEDLLANIETTKSDSAVSPRFGIVYQPIRAISLYASYISSFTPAQGTFLFGGSLQSAFDPERGRQYEVGVKADFNDRLSATLAFYDLTRTNVLVDDPTTGFQIQTGEQNSQGIELSVTGQILPGWNIFAGYAYTNARITEDATFPVGNRLPNTADHAFNVWTTYEIQQGNLQGLGFGLGLFFVGDRAGDLDNTYYVPSSPRTDAAIFYNRDRFRIGLNFKNLFDVEYFENTYFGGRVGYGQPFTVQGTVSWQF